MTIRFEHGALSHEGRVRTNNEDAWCARPRDGLYAVADGMGGHEHGEWASAKIVELLEAVELPADFDAAWMSAVEALQAANLAIWRESQRRGQQMGSTVVVLLLRGERFAVLWVGDSRVYLSRRGALAQVSRDHSQVQEMVTRGLLTPAQAVDHPMRHVLARALGVGDVVDVDVISDRIEHGDAFLLCSDGLTARVSDAEIGKMLYGADPYDLPRALVALTLDRGAPDNVTVIAVASQQATIPILSNPSFVVGR